MEEAPSSGLLTKVIAAVVLLVAGWIVIKIAIGVVAALFWTVLAVVAVLAVLWAVFTLRS